MFFQRGNRVGHGHCGPITYIHETFLSKEIAIENVHTSWDYLCVQLSHTSSNSKRYLLCNVYRLPCYLSEDINLFTTQFSNFLRPVKHINTSVFMYVQQCFGEIRDSSRCRLYREIKFTFEMEPYLQNNCNRELRQCLTKIRLSSHKFLVERGRWAKPQISYQERKCTLCGQLDVEDEYHILLICS